MSCFVISGSPLIELRPHRSHPQFGGAIGSSVFGVNKAAFFEAHEDLQRTATQHMAFAGKASNLLDFPIGPPQMTDFTAQRQFMQNALFLF